MMKSMAVVAFAVMALFGTMAAGGPVEPPTPASHGARTVSQDQFQVLTDQCKYVKATRAQSDCRAAVERDYKIGEADATLDCRTYSGVSVCGVLNLSETQKRCAEDSVAQGLTYRRAEVECYAFS
ncbi:hypothetical protein [Sphaerisporangium corydalis]|uniref:Subtilisin inhibitor domain-containing protein n=1 Tax=Sphaerisporangium corydalis TaxID=1441875 RepID=A0ABV9E549_9ACTN|nr:hypothetical protein [Sphaerisporangium corydalis]